MNSPGFSGSRAGTCVFACLALVLAAPGLGGVGCSSRSSVGRDAAPGSGGAPAGTGTGGVSAGSGGAAAGGSGGVAVGSGGAAVGGSGGVAGGVGAGEGGRGGSTSGGAPGTGGTGGASVGSGGAAGVGSGGRASTGGGPGGGGSSGAAGAGGAPARTTLDIYFIDVEGGAATLLVSPSGQSMLVDAGNPGNGDRDVNRVLAVVNNEARLARIDYVVTTHFHVDHVGGITALASRFPVGQFMDHGSSVEGGANYTGYVAAIAGKTRVMVKPGDRLQLGELDVVFVAAAGQLADPLPTAIANPHCAGAPQMPERPTDENPQSVGFVARFGTFDFVDLGDLTWAVEDRLMCPTNRIGTIDLLQVSHHGLEISSSPQLVHGLSPLVAVMNNGATKGGAVSTFDTLKSSPGIGDIWALHRAVNNDAAHNAVEALIANVSTSPDAGHFVKASVARDGTYVLTNARNGETRTYRSR